VSAIRISSKMKVKLEDVPEVERIFRKFIEDARAKDPGMTDLAYYVDEEQGVIHAHEGYESFEAFQSHLGNMDQQAVGRLMELVELSPFEYDGDPTPEAREMMSNFGQVNFHRPLVQL
jgi:quinol monooxygenase YgiN